MNSDVNPPLRGNDGSWNAQASCLRLVRSTAVSIAPTSKAVWAETTIACPSRLRLVGVRRAGTTERPHDQRRPTDRRNEGNEMKAMEGFLYSMSRFVFGLGIGLALTSVYVIVTSTPDLLVTRTGAGDVIVLEPVVVTISAARFDAIRTEAEPASRTVHLYGKGAQQIEVKPS